MKIEIQYPILNITLPITKKDLVLRVMRIKEEKILLTAQSSKNQAELLHAMMVCLTNCLVEPSDLKLDNIPFFDLQYMFLQLRSASVNKISKLLIQDEYNKIKKHEVVIDITNVNFEFKSETTKIMFTETSGIEMIYPTFSIVKKLLNYTNPTEKTLEFLKLCIKNIFTDTNVYNTSSMSANDISEYIESLPASYFIKLKEYVDNLPKITYNIEYINTKGEHKNIVLDDLENFT
jgi:hypothetical protein